MGAQTGTPSVFPLYITSTSYSSLAQSVEHLTVNQGVTGSSPVGGAIKTLENTMFSRVFVISQGLKGLQKIQFLRFGGLHTRMTVNQAKYRRKDHLALTTTCLQSSAFQWILS